MAPNISFANYIRIGRLVDISVNLRGTLSVHNIQGLRDKFSSLDQT